MEALNLTGVPADLGWRQPGNFYYPPDICEVLVELPSPAALAPVLLEFPLITQASLPPSEVSKVLGQIGDQGQGAEVAKDKGKGKEVKPPSEDKVAPKAKDAIETKDVAAKVKEVKAKSKDAHLKAKDAPVSQLGNKKDPHP